ncbi:hypothetical protein BH11BAC3_BH11BAC3_26170 [soil metagenome]
MEENFQPIFANGKICYLEIPASDIAVSANFYKVVFGWHIREDDGGNIFFDDPTGQVSGMWVTGRQPATNPGIMISIMVNNIANTIKLVTANDGQIVQAPNEGSSEKIALFSDPAGNVFCLYQHQL